MVLLNSAKRVICQRTLLGWLAVSVLVMGGVLGAAMPSAAQQNTVIVQPGDTLAAIAARTGTTVQALMTANSLVNPNLIYIGQVLVLPVVPRPTTVTVLPGENLSAIAARFGVTLESLLAANNFTAGTTIRPGDVLALPATGGPVTVIGQTYTVQRGDTLASIAARFNTSVAALQSVNYLANLNRILPGQVLNIPAQGGLAQGGMVPVQDTVTYPVTINGYYIVQYGDTMLGIASVFGVDAWTIARANGIYNLNHVYAGQALLIPGR